MKLGYIEAKGNVHYSIAKAYAITLSPEEHNTRTKNNSEAVSVGNEMKRRFYIGIGN